MGNSHSTSSTAGRRRSLLREEFMFPELDLETDWECEVYCVDVELQPLPPHAHDAHHVCVDDYTQEILSWEGKCVCSCHVSAAEIGARCPQNESDQDTVCACLQSETGGEFCMQLDVYPEEACSLDAGGTETDDLSVAELLDILLDEDMALNDLEGRCVENYGNLHSPYNEEGAEANTPRHDGTEEPVSRSEQKTQESAELKDSLENIQSRKVSCSAKVSEKESSVYRERKCGAVTSRVWTDRRVSTTVLETRPTTMTSERNTVQDQTQTPRSGGVTVHPRRKSCSIPVPQSHASAMHFKRKLDSKKRKFSLKDDPGWIPNPLDSDSDSCDFEDSGVFSDYTGSPAMSASPLSCASFTPRAAATTTTQTRSLQMQRRRYNSEPMPGRSTTPSYSPVHTVFNSPPLASSTIKQRSGWGILRLTRKIKKTEKADDPVAQAEDSVLDEEDDLTEQLRWLTMSDYQLSQDAGSISEQGEEDFDTQDAAEDFNTWDTSPDILLTGFPAEPAGETRDPLSCEQGAAGQRMNRFDGELELDWLCEPEWNNLELELFWSLLRPHLENLLQPEDSEHLPEACEAVGHMDAADPKLLDRCLLHVQWHIWKGSYCQAVADFRAVRRHFLCCAQSQLIESGTRDDVENLRLLFQRKRPSRFRLWI